MDRPTGVREVMGSYLSGTRIPFLSHARVMLISSHFITELKIHHLYSFITLHSSFQLCLSEVLSGHVLSPKDDDHLIRIFFTVELLVLVHVCVNVKIHSAAFPNLVLYVVNFSKQMQLCVVDLGDVGNVDAFVFRCSSTAK